MTPSKQLIRLISIDYLIPLKCSYLNSVENTFYFRLLFSGRTEIELLQNIFKLVNNVVKYFKLLFNRAPASELVLLRGGLPSEIALQGGSLESKIVYRGLGADFEKPKIYIYVRLTMTG